ncbi:MAG: hypothetical protein ABI806_28850 [Candidatus Solibacter sp.]
MQQQQTKKDVRGDSEVQPERADDRVQRQTPAMFQRIERIWKRTKEQSTKSEGHCGNNLPKIRYPSLELKPRTFCEGAPVIRPGETSGDRGG